VKKSPNDFAKPPSDFATPSKKDFGFQIADFGVSGRASLSPNDVAVCSGLLAKKPRHLPPPRGAPKAARTARV
jgi:hypothetical protein